MKDRSAMRAIPRLLLLLVSASVVVAAGNPLPNPGFEAGDSQWVIADEASHVAAEAARTGQLGLRVGQSEYYPSGSSIHSARFAVVAGQRISLSFWARSRAANCGIYFWFADAKGKPVGSPPMCGVKDSQGEWREYAFEADVPTRAETVGIWVHSYAGARGEVDLDDFAIGGLAADAAAIPAPPPRKRAAPLPALAPGDIPPRTTPAVIILKFDDVKQMKGGDVHARWKRLADYLEAKQIKGSFGVLCETLGQAEPTYVQWFADRRKAGFVEFWFHGYDHATHEVDGERWNEFNRRSYEDQKARVATSQALAREKLGFAFETFGPPGGVGSASFDEATLRVMAEDPDIRIMLYPQPIDKAGARYDADGTLKILDRVWEVNLEGAVGVPDFRRFLAGYAKNPDREYFVLQGHPAAWDDARFAEFERIVDFLVARNDVFMTPSGFVARQVDP
jgi:peptidoglycan/xylan/chitin deacetylase (PgdA/CDA1 family)